MQGQRACSKIGRDLGRKKQKKITAVVQGYYPNPKQNSDQEQYFVVSKVNEIQTLFVKRRLRAAKFQ